MHALGRKLFKLIHSRLSRSNVPAPPCYVPSKNIYPVASKQEKKENSWKKKNQSNGASDIVPTPLSEHWAAFLVAGDECHCLRLLDGIIREREDIRQPAYSPHGRFIRSTFRITTVRPWDAPGGVFCGASLATHRIVKVHLEHIRYLFVSVSSGFNYSSGGDIVFELHEIKYVS